MHFAVTREHREHFRRYGWVEFEDLLTEQEVEEGLALFQTLSGNHDFWRRHEWFKKMACRRRFAEAARDLGETRGGFRLAYDRLYPQNNPPDKVVTLSEISAFQPIVAGLVLSFGLDSNEQLKGVEGAPVPLMASKRGGGIFIHPHALFELNQFKPDQPCWLLAYADATTLYIANAQDPFVHEPKNFGYTFGDRLKDSEFPLLLKPV